MGSQARAEMADLIHELRTRTSGEVRFDEMTRVLYSTDPASMRSNARRGVSPLSEDVIGAIEICGRMASRFCPEGRTALAGQAVGRAVHLECPSISTGLGGKRGGALGACSTRRRPG